MSMGFGASAKIAAQDAHTIVYEYCTYNLNEKDFENPNRISDGIITIERSALVEAEITKKTKHLPKSRKKVVIKRITRDVNYDTLIETKKIQVENSRFCWGTLDNGIDKMAILLIREIFDLYQKESSLPEKVVMFY